MQKQPAYGAYPCRTSMLGLLNIVNVSSASVIQLGDREETNAKLQALAVQRQAGHRQSGDAFFESYPIFARERPTLIDAADTELIHQTTTHLSPHIHVGIIRVLAVSSAAHVLAGNSCHLVADSRIKHIRQYAKPSFC